MTRVENSLYPNRDEIKDLLLKATALHAVPVLIARRIPFVTYRLLQPCGVILWQTYRQRYPLADTALAEKARHKRLLGFHDIQTGNDPGPHLTRFIHKHLPETLPKARARYNEYYDLLRAFGSKDIGYNEFSTRVIRRSQGLPEDSDEFDEDWSDY